MILLYIQKPEIIFNNKKQKFKSSEETIFSIETIGLILPVIIYGIINYIVKIQQYKNLYIQNLRAGC